MHPFNWQDLADTDWRDCALVAAKCGRMDYYELFAEMASIRREPVDLGEALRLAIEEGGDPQLVMLIVHQMQADKRDWNEMAALAAWHGQMGVFLELVERSEGRADDWDRFAMCAAGFGAHSVFWDIVTLSEGKARRWGIFAREAWTSGHQKLARDILRFFWIFGPLGWICRKWPLRERRGARASLFNGLVYSGLYGAGAFFRQKSVAETPDGVAESAGREWRQLAFGAANHRYVKKKRTYVAALGRLRVWPPRRQPDSWSMPPRPPR